MLLLKWNRVSVSLGRGGNLSPRDTENPSLIVSDLFLSMHLPQRDCYLPYIVF